MIPESVKSSREGSIEDRSATHVKLLVVDDRPDTLFALRAALEDVCDEVACAESGEDALRYLVDGDFAAILLDVHMPNMGGFETARLIRTRSKLRHTPILFLTGYGDQEILAEGYSLGAVDFLQKPVMPEMLRAKVSVFVELARRAQLLTHQAAEIQKLNAELEERVIERTRALQERDAELELVNNGVPVLLSRIDKNRIYRRVNQTYTTWFGKSAEEIVGRTVPEITGEPHATIAKPYFERALRGEHVSFESQFRRADGEMHDVFVTYTPEYAADGSIQGLVAMLQDITEQRRAAKSLEESEERFRTAFAQAAIGMALTDTAGHFLQVNQAYCDIVGYTKEDLARLDFASISHPEDRERNLAFVRRMLAGEIPSFIIEKRYAKKDGGVVWVRNSVSLIRDAQGQPANMIALTEDITDRMQAEAALTERARLTALAADTGAALAQIENLQEALKRCAEAIVLRLDAAFARIWTLDAAGAVLELQASAGMYTHLDGAHARVPVGAFKIGSIARERKPHLTNDVAHDPSVSDHEWAAQVGMVAFAGYPLIVEDRVVGVVGMFARRALEQEALDALGSVANSMAMAIERRRAEEERKELFARERAVRHEAETINRLGQLLVAELDVEKVVQAVTDAATELTRAQFGAFFYNVLNEQGESYMLYTISGVPREEFSKFPMPRNTAVFAPTFSGAGVVRVGNIREDPRYGKNAPHYGMPKGHLPVRSYLAVPVISRSGEVIGGLFFGHEQADVFTEADERMVAGLAGQTAIAMDNARLFQAAERARAQAESTAHDLSRSNADLERFAFAASHDLQEPLRMVTSYSQLLARKYKGHLDEEAHEILGYILSGAARMGTLIEDLLSYSQVVHTMVEAVPVDCNAVLEEVLAGCHTAIAESEAVITHSELPTIPGDESQVAQLLQNLITNALKYRKRDEAPRIHITAEERANEWLFSVEDNGIGIAPQYREQVFVIFKRLHKRSEYPGTGVGLALCQRIVEGCGGKIWVDSEPGVGSTFRFTWPKHHCSESTSTHAPS